MLEKPDLPDDLIIACLQQAYDLQHVKLEFLALGNDSSAAVYKVSTENATYFLKIKQGVTPLVTVEVPHYLAASSIPQIVSPILNHHHMLWTPIQKSMLMLYPFIDGQTGMETGLSSEQWQEFGTILKKLHSVELPSQVAVFVPRETFVPTYKWLVIIEALQLRLPEVTFDLVVQQQLAAFWSENREKISRIVIRTEELGRQLQARALPFVLCHADIHTANVLVDREGRLFIVDWDQTIFAPKERDLMFIVGSRDTAIIEGQSEQAFLNGYEHPDINWLAVAYYRYEWVVQEIADFAKRVFYMPELDTATKQDALRGFKQLFLPDDVVASAYASEAHLT